MVDGKIPFKVREEQSLKASMDLFGRATDLKKRALKIVKQEGEDKNENIKS